MKNWMKDKTFVALIGTTLGFIILCVGIASWIIIADHFGVLNHVAVVSAIVMGVIGGIWLLVALYRGAKSDDRD